MVFFLIEKIYGSSEFFSIFYKWLHSLQVIKFVGFEAYSNKYVLVDELFERSTLDCVIIEMLTKVELLPFKNYL